MFHLVRTTSVLVQNRSVYPLVSNFTRVTANQPLFFSYAARNPLNRDHKSQYSKIEVNPKNLFLASLVAIFITCCTGKYCYDQGEKSGFNRGFGYGD